MKLPDFASLKTETSVLVFSDLPALKLGRNITGIAAETTAAVFWLFAAFAAVFPVQRCGESPPALKLLDYQSDRSRTQLRNRVRLQSDLQWVSSFQSPCSWIIPEQLQNNFEPVGSEENHQA